MALRRHCLDCHRLISTGSRCKGCDAARWPARPRTRPTHGLREQVLADHHDTCAGCGSSSLPVELHHRDHDPTNTTRDNLIPLCRSCHRKAER